MRAPVPFSPPPLPVPSSPVVRDDVPLDAIDAGRSGTRSRGGQPLPVARVPHRAARDRLRVAAARAGRRATSRRGAAARSSARCRSTRRRTATANTCSTGAGPMPTGATAAATIRSCVAAVPFTPVPGPRLLARRRRARGARCSHARWPRAPRAGAIRRCTCCSRRGARPREGEALGMIAAPRACSSTGATPATATSTTSSRRSRTTSARRCSRSGASCAEAGVTLRAQDAARDHARPTGRFFYRCYEAHLSRASLDAVPHRANSSSASAARMPRQRRCSSSASATAQPLCAALDVYDARHAVGPLLGHARIRPGPALRGVLLPGDRVLHRAAASRASKAARRACTSSRAACCPVTTHSLHAIGDPAFADAIADYLRARARRRRALRWTSSPSRARSGEDRDSSDAPC